MLFQCPNLTHLSYESGSLGRATTTTVIRDINEFRLERLMYCEVQSPFVGQYLAPLVAPNVQDLRIETAWTSLGVNVLKGILEKMEGLKTFRTGRVEIAEAVIEIFAIKPEDREHSILCPKLVTLDICCSMPEDGDLKPILKEVAESRHIAGIPLGSITYHTPTGEGWTCVKGDSDSSTLPIYSFHPLK